MTTGGLEGQVLDGTYRLLRRVGEGGMGVVYEATHARLAGRYAIKLLTPEFAKSPDALAHINREARLTSLLQHPNIVQVIDHNITADGTGYLVMEYLAGESLSQRLLREGRLPLETVASIVDQIAAGLSAAHAHGIVHRDLKPDNVFLVPVEGRSELVKILDFGISLQRGSLEMRGLVCGTPQYMAPEQVDGRQADVDGSTDQFALAVMTLEMLTGRNPFLAETVQATFVRITSGSAVSSGLGREVDAALSRGLARSTHGRFPSVRDFAEAFRTAALAEKRIGERPAALTGAQPRGNGRERTRRSRGRSWGLALGATVAATLATSLVAGGSPDRLLTAGRAHAPSVTPASPAAPSSTPQPLPGPGFVPATPTPAVEALDDPPAAPAAEISRPKRRTPATGAPLSPQNGRRLGLHPTRSASPLTSSRPGPADVDEDATMPLTELSGRDSGN